MKIPGVTLETVEAVDGKVIDLEPCRKCAGLMGEGIILITIDPSKSGPGWEREKLPNPYRTGGWFVVTEEAFQRIVEGPELVRFALRHRWLFIDHTAAEQIGLFAVAPLRTE